MKEGGAQWWGTAEKDGPAVRKKNGVTVVSVS